MLRDMRCIRVESLCQHSTSQTGEIESSSAVAWGPVRERHGADLGSGGDGWRLRFILFACEALLHLVSPGEVLCGSWCSPLLGRLERLWNLEQLSSG